MSKKLPGPAVSNSSIKSDIRFGRLGFVLFQTFCVYFEIRGSSTTSSNLLSSYYHHITEYEKTIFEFVFNYLGYS